MWISNDAKREDLLATNWIKKGTWPFIIQWKVKYKKILYQRVKEIRFLSECWANVQSLLCFEFRKRDGSALRFKYRPSPLVSAVRSGPERK